MISWKYSCLVMSVSMVTGNRIKSRISIMRKIMIHIIIAVLIMVIVNMSVMWIRLPVK